MLHLQQFGVLGDWEINKLSVLAVAGVLLAGPALAQEPGQFGVGVGVSTLGFTVEGTYRINDRFGLRLPVGFAEVDYSGDEDDFDF